MTKFDRSFRLVLFVLSCGLTAPVLQADERPTAKPVPGRAALEDSLQRRWRTFLEVARDGDDAALSKELESLMPTRADLNVLFPKHADDLAEVVNAGLSRLKSNLAGFRTGRSRDVVTLEPEDCRSPDNASLYGEVLKLVPETVPVYRLTVRSTSRLSGAGTFVYVNDRWIWFKGFEGTPRMLPMLPEILKQIRGTQVK